MAYRVDIFVAITEANIQHIHNLKGYLLGKYQGFSLVEVEGYYRSVNKNGFDFTTYIENSYNFIIMMDNYPSMLQYDIEQLFENSGEDSILMTVTEINTSIFIPLKNN